MHGGGLLAVAANGTRALLAYQSGDLPAGHKLITAQIPEVARTIRGASLLASVSATGGDSKAALMWLGAATEQGYANYPRLSQGSEYKFLRGDSEFEAILAGVKTKHEVYKRAWQ